MSIGMSLARLAAPQHNTRGDQGRLVLGEHIASQPEVIRAVMSGYSPCCVGSRTWRPAARTAPTCLAIGETVIVMEPPLHPY